MTKTTMGPWSLHLVALLVLVALPVGGFAAYAALDHDISAILAFAFFIVPLAIAYTLLSSLVLVILRHGMREAPALRGWRCVALAHGIGLVGSVLAPLLMMRMR